MPARSRRVPGAGRLLLPFVIATLAPGARSTAQEPSTAAVVAAPTPERLLRQAGLKFASGELEAARDAAGAAIELAPADPRGYLQRAMAQLALGAYGPAEQDAGAAIERGARKAAAFSLRARARAALGRPSAEVIADWRQAAELDARYGPELEQAEKRLPRVSAETASPPSAAGSRPARARGLPLLPILGVAGGAALLAVVVAGARHGRARRVRFGSVMTITLPAGELRPGTVIGGRLIVGRLLERDGGAEVYEGRDLEDRPKLVKRLSGGAETLKRAAASASLRHPNICTIETSFAEGPHVFLAYEPIEGDTLRRLLDRSPQRRLLPEQALRVVKSVCEALSAAHGAGVSHGALTPSAILVERAAVRVKDFGLPSGALAADYAAPETGPSPAGDLFALGACLYEALCGERPFKGADGAQAKREGRFAPASSLAAALGGGGDDFFTRALSPEPGRRFASPEEFFAAFSALVVPAG